MGLREPDYLGTSASRSTDQAGKTIAFAGTPSAFPWPPNTSYTPGDFPLGTNRHRAADCEDPSDKEIDGALGGCA